MMFTGWSVARPSNTQLEATLAAHDGDALSYDHVGATDAPELPTGWTHHVHAAELGRGEATFLAAVDAIQHWQMFQVSWVELLRPVPPPVADQVVAFASMQFGVWLQHVCRVVYVVDERDGPVWRYGFAYGTVPRHTVRGEERFLVEWDRRTDVVRFEVRKFSRLRHPLLRLAGPVARFAQVRFSLDAIAAMQRAVARIRIPEAA